MGKATTLNDLLTRCGKQYQTELNRFESAKRAVANSFPSDLDVKTRRGIMRQLLRDKRGPRLMSKLESRIYPRGKTLLKLRMLNSSDYMKVL